METEQGNGFKYQDALESPLPYEREVREVQAGGFDDVFGLFPVNVTPLG